MKNARTALLQPMLSTQLMTLDLSYGRLTGCPRCAQTVGSFRGNSIEKEGPWKPAKVSFRSFLFFFLKIFERNLHMHVENKNRCRRQL